jgi:mono/diheme cytochrome c family protein
MYHSVPYEPLKQITDPSAGSAFSDRSDGYGEFYNSNPNNPHTMNMRPPVPNTVRRSPDGLLPYRVPKDSFDYAANYVHNPLDSTTEIVAQGKELYTVFCAPCHGDQGKGDGLVGQVYKGVAAYNVGRVKELPEGHIFHTITHGRGRMGAHGSQIDVLDRWKIVRYVQVLQNSN